MTDNNPDGHTDVVYGVAGTDWQRWGYTRDAAIAKAASETAQFRRRPERVRAVQRTVTYSPVTTVDCEQLELP